MPPIRLMLHRDVAAIDDTTFVASSSSDPEALLTRWTPTREEGFVRVEDLGEAVDWQGAPPSEDDLITFHVTRDSGGTLWALGAVRRLDQHREDALRRETAERVSGASNPDDPFVRYHPAVANEVYDGLLLRLDDDGAISAALRLDDYPRGFADAEHFFTLHETDVGLLRTRIWRIEEDCAGPAEP